MNKLTIQMLAGMGLLLLVLSAFTGCAGKSSRTSELGNLREYSQWNDSPRQILPEDYVSYLKQYRFTNGELDHLPEMAVILHFANMDGFLLSAGFQTNEWTVLATGSTDPNVLYVVHPQNGRPFIINRGLPGAGGIATQTAELGALGVRKIIHIGTAGLLGETIPDADLMVSAGAYKDGGAVMLSDFDGGNVDPIARPDANLVKAVEKVLQNKNIPFEESIGYTMPIFYFQPAGLVQALLASGTHSRLQTPKYMEMEEAAFFQTCHRMHIQAASVVIGSDRYVMANNQLKHEWLGDTDAAVRIAIKAAVEAMQSLP